MGELKSFYRIYADVRNSNGSIVAAKMKQNDTKTRYLDITVTDNGVPVDLTDCEVRIYGRKYDKTEFYNDGIIQDATMGRCLFEATTQMLAYSEQNVNCEIVVFKNNVQILSTMPFDIFVVKSLMGDSAIESSNEYGALVVLFQNLYEAYDLMTRMVQNMGNAGTIAADRQLTTFWQMSEYLAKYMDTDLRQKIDDALANSAVQGVLDKLDNEIIPRIEKNETLNAIARNLRYDDVLKVKKETVFTLMQSAQHTGRTSLVLGSFVIPENCRCEIGYTLRMVNTGYSSLYSGELYVTKKNSNPTPDTGFSENLFSSSVAASTNSGSDGRSVTETKDFYIPEPGEYYIHIVINNKDYSCLTVDVSGFVVNITTWEENVIGTELHLAESPKKTYYVANSIDYRDTGYLPRADRITTEAISGQSTAMNMLIFRFNNKDYACKIDKLASSYITERY